jgi:hypothetical protein
MDVLVVLTILSEVLGIYILILLIFPNLLTYVGYNKTGIVLSIVFHFLGGYLMFFS